MSIFLTMAISSIKHMGQDNMHSTLDFILKKMKYLKPFLWYQIFERSFAYLDNSIWVMIICTPNWISLKNMKYLKQFSWYQIFQRSSAYLDNSIWVRIICIPNWISLKNMKYLKQFSWYQIFHRSFVYLDKVSRV